MKDSSNPAIKLELKPSFQFTHISVTTHKSHDLCLYPRVCSFWLTYRKFSPGRLDTKTTRQEAGTPVVIVSEAPSELLRSPDQRLPGNHSDGSTQPCYSTHEQSLLVLQQTTDPLPSTVLPNDKTSMQKEQRHTQKTLASPALASRLNIDLKADKITCLAITQKGVRCKYGIAMKTLKAAREVLEQLEKENLTHLDWQPPVDQLGLLANLLHCKNRHQDQAHPLTTRWAEAVNRTKRDGPAASLPFAQNPISLLASALNRTQLGEYDYTKVCIRGLIPYDARARTTENTAVFVQGAMRRGLTRREVQTEGYIYIYNFPGNFGHVKIGVTSKSPEERLQCWQKQCGHVPELLFPKTEDDLVPMPHVYRVEKLVHAQLRNYRKKELQCRKCRKSHVEWFESSVPEAIAAARRWSIWIREKPYEKGTTGDWVLAKSQKEKIGALCRGVEEDRQAYLTLQKQEQERSRKLSVSPGRHHRTLSEGSLRTSSRIANRKERRRSMAGDTSDTQRVLPFKLGNECWKVDTG